MSVRRRTTSIVLRSVLAAMAAISVAGCGLSSITPTRIEAALERTFANLVELQVSRLGLPPMPAPDFAVTAICQKQLAGTEKGAGDRRLLRGDRLRREPGRANPQSAGWPHREESPLHVRRLLRHDVTQ
jgi:hypothetical protein